MIHKLEKEIPAILGLSIKAIAKAYQRGQFTTPQSSIDLVRKWQADADQIKLFVQEECILTPEGKEQVGRLYTHYQYWAQDAGFRKLVTRNGFTKRLASLGVESKQSTQGKFYYFGIIQDCFGDI